MAQEKKKDWSQEESGQIAVYKTDKALIELWDNLKPSSRRFPAHIHAMGEKSEAGERSRIRVNMLDYSQKVNGESTYVTDNLTPEDVKYIYSALFCHLLEFDFRREKIFGEPNEKGYSTVRKMQITRYETDSQGRKRNFPWFVEIENGCGIPQKNSNGGTFCQKDSYICETKVRIFLNDEDMFRIFCRTEAYIRAFELEYAFRQNRIGNFFSLYQMLSKEIQELAAALLRDMKKEAA